MTMAIFVVTCVLAVAGFVLVRRWLLHRAMHRNAMFFARNYAPCPMGGYVRRFGGKGGWK